MPLGQSFGIGTPQQCLTRHRRKFPIARDLIAPLLDPAAILRKLGYLEFTSRVWPLIAFAVVQRQPLQPIAISLYVARIRNHYCWSLFGITLLQHIDATQLLDALPLEFVDVGDHFAVIQIHESAAIEGKQTWIGFDLIQQLVLLLLGPRSNPHRIDPGHQHGQQRQQLGNAHGTGRANPHGPHDSHFTLGIESAMSK